jgi:predicted RNA-binding Zn-ribbon protein involved in translation (DUF1610 family)
VNSDASGTRVKNLIDDPCFHLPTNENWSVDYNNQRCIRRNEILYSSSILKTEEAACPSLFDGICYKITYYCPKGGDLIERSKYCKKVETIYKLFSDL